MYGEKAAAMVQRLEQATWLPPYDDTMREVLTEIDELPPDECEIREQRAEAQSIKMHFDSCELAGNHFHGFPPSFSFFLPASNRGRL